ncbi:uncharacterized protein LOC109714628 [Ananas comosus]|uniref:Uncharacterized protein LOC109714628 n=1 Tax=Ananas comosus TaxID=4615 RepID=A0A6P5FN56_ANACO|nr:uncharacterized protein LOC109714628 [Ananas comosus]
MSGTSQPKEEEKMSATSQPKEKKMSATSEPFLMDDDRTLTEVTFARAHRITTTVTHSDVVVERWIGETAGGCSYGVRSNPSHRPFVGLEVVCQPNGNIVLLQLCVSNRCLIYQLLHRDHDTCPLYELFVFLNSTRFCFVGAGVEVVAYGLRRGHGFFVRNKVDLGEAAARRLGREDLRRAGLERLAREVMRVEMDTPAEVRRSEWWRRDLSHEQIACACAHAFASFELGRILVKQS